MNITNAPSPARPADLIPEEIGIYYNITLLLFSVFFFFSLHYWLHVRQHLIPPPYAFWLRELWQRWRGK